LIATVSCVEVSQSSTVSAITQTGVTWAKQVGNTHTFSSSYYFDAEIWLGVVGSGASTSITVTFSADTEGAAANVCEYSGLQSAGYLDRTASAWAESTTPNTGTTTTTSDDAELWIGCTSVGNTVTASATNGFTRLDGALVNGWCSNSFYEKIVSTQGTANTGVSMDNVWWVGCVATFEATPAPPADPEGVDLVINGNSTILLDGDLVTTPDTFHFEDGSTHEINATSEYVEPYVEPEGVDLSVSGNSTITLDGDAVATPDAFHFEDGSTHEIEALAPMGGGSSSSAFWIVALVVGVVIGLAAGSKGS
jgi:hypothetical protein